MELNMKKVFGAALIALGMLTFSGVSIPPAKAQSLTSAPQPSPEIQSLTKALEGKWSLHVKFEPASSAPNGLANTGEETWRPGPGGFTLLEEEHLRMPREDVFLLGIVWWNSLTKSFQGMECQNALPYTCDVKGSLTNITMSWDGKQFIIDELETHNGQKSMWHEVWSDITPTSFTQIGESSKPGGPRKRVFTIQATRAASADTAAIAETIKTDVAQLVAGLNAHDAVKTTAYDAPDIISMACGSPSTVGIKADREEFRMNFDRDPLWRVSLIDETVDVASSGDLAVYRGAYNEDNSHEGALMTHKTNFIAEFKRQDDGTWKIVWYSVSNMERSHPK
jgi:ketosteroid isomerase-like protein